ncbi:MAG: hypothetical protein DRJ01_03025 [Bacteroidetes bacterium]|nr:MAG: hypothetical protein DRJ01_03025 [Bacteroidota bacterium]
MNKVIKSLIVSLLLVFFFAQGADAQKRKDRKALYNSKFNYQIQCLGVGNDGTKLFKVWGFDKNAKNAAYKAKRNAVAACIFRGIPAGGGADKTPAIVTDPDADKTHKEFFDEFFAAGGKYLQYVNVTTDGAPSGKDRIRVKRGYKVAVIVSIAYDDLRKYLEEKGVARSLSHGF